AVITGDGFGKPMGILNPAAGIPICETAPGTEPGTFRWQDLVALRWEIPVNFQDQGAYIMNSRTWGLVSTMSDTAGRPIMVAAPTQASPFLINGAPVIVNNLMPTAEPGSAPVIYGNWRQCYTIVTRRAVTMQSDPYSQGWCTLFKFDTRVGGGCTCPNA